MDRLFILRDFHGNPFIGIPRANGALSFKNKKDAKDRRDELNKTGMYPVMHVSPGPDHRRMIK